MVKNSDLDIGLPARANDRSLSCLFAEDTLSESGTGRQFTVASPDTAVCEASAKKRHDASMLSSSFPLLADNDSDPLPSNWSLDRRRPCSLSDEEKVVVPSSTLSSRALMVASSRRTSNRPAADLPLTPLLLLDCFWPYFRFCHSPSKSRERDDERRRRWVTKGGADDDGAAGTNAAAS